jgi:tetratricopeptide (TPR) repeat protein
MKPKNIARSKLLSGCAAENIGDFDLAVKEYRKGLEHPSEDFFVQYFLNNNLGYSLIQIGDFADAEKYCRQAIEIDPHKYNAHKNLGLALQGEGQYLGAANSLQLASMMSPNPRAKQHLDELLSEHPEIKDLMQELEVVETKYHIVQIGTSSNVVH